MDFIRLFCWFLWSYLSTAYDIDAKTVLNSHSTTTISRITPGEVGGGYRGITDDWQSLAIYLGCEQLRERQACQFSDFISPCLLSGTHCTLQDGFCKVWWSCHMSITHHFSFLLNTKQAVTRDKDCSYSFSNLLICDVPSVWDV